MAKCAICLTAEATQTGSHLLSAFMVESTIGKRGNEKGYILDDEPNFDYRINTGAAPIVEDYLFCRGCEQRMSYVEGYVCSEYRDKFKKGAFHSNFKSVSEKNYSIQEAFHVNYYAFLLFLCTVLLKISLTKKKLFNAFELRPDEQEKLRNLINECLPPYLDYKVKIKQTHFLRDITQKAELFQDLYFVLVTYENLADETTSFNTADPYYRLPYNFMFGQVILYFFFSKPRSGGKYLDFFKLLDELELDKVINGEGNSLKTVFIPEDRWNQILDIPRQLLLKNKMPGLMQLFLQEHGKATHNPPTNQDWLNFIERSFPDADK